jgi:hypothetical protein
MYYPADCFRRGDRPTLAGGNIPGRRYCGDLDPDGMCQEGDREARRSWGKIRQMKIKLWIERFRQNSDDEVLD